MKISELSNAKLDYWVAVAEGKNKPAIDGNICVYERYDDGSNMNVSVAFGPSFYWVDGGPIIEREKITVEPMFHDIEPWIARIQDTKSTRRLHLYGSTPLIAAMRAYVASKFGAEVPGEV